MNAPVQIGDVAPAVCFVDDVCRHLRISRSALYRQLSRGQMPLQELTRIDARRRFSGESVEAIKRRGRYPARRSA